MARLLLIGNSRWHWAELQGQRLRCWHTPAQAGPGLIDSEDLLAWAAVGSLPEGLGLPQHRRIQLQDVPLQALPAWLGIDRALVGWRAWRQQGDAVLVADAGTALSLTRISAAGEFAGGRISAGVALQLRALGHATAQLPNQLPPVLSAGPDPWPVATAAAMAEGCIRATAAAVVQAWHDLDPVERGGLWLTGGDAELLLPLLQQQLRPELAPDLALEALAALPAVGLLA